MIGWRSHHCDMCFHHLCVTAGNTAYKIDVVYLDQVDHESNGITFYPSVCIGYHTFILEDATAEEVIVYRVFR